MAGEIKHEWNGTILTIISDSGISSMDLKGSKGDDGCRGPQGPAGVIVDANGNIDWNGYATEQWVTEQIASVSEVDMSDYYTRNETNVIVNNAVAGNLSGYATEEYVNNKVIESEVYLEEYVDSFYHNITGNYATQKYVTDKMNDKLDKDRGIARDLTVDGGLILTSHGAQDGFYFYSILEDDDLEKPKVELLGTYNDSPVRVGCIATPIDPLDAANKKYVDDAIAGVGGGSADLSNYYTKTEIDNLLGVIENGAY
jgi:hypothetical protein